MKISGLLIIGSLFISGTAYAERPSFSQNPFTDVPTNSSDYKAIEFLRTQNIVRGYMDGTFRPNMIINRAEFVEFIINPLILNTNGLKDCVSANTSTEAKTIFFSDVSINAWYAENVCFAKTKKIIDGYPDGTFRPEASINFVEAAKIISNVFSLNIATYQEGEFWFRPYVQSLSDSHAIPSNIKRVDQTLSRSDMAQIVYSLKVDSPQKVSMLFDQASNSLYQRAPLPVLKTPKPPENVIVYIKPTRRSIIDDSELLSESRSRR